MEPRDEIWPALDYPGWAATCETLHRWTQIVGKIRMTLSPWINHSWHVVLYPTARGLTTGPIPHQQRIFWGSFDLAVTRFSGRTAPRHPGGIPHLPDKVTREAYSHEESSLGFWPGNAEVPTPLFYSYAYPSPENFARAAIAPDAAYFHEQLKEWVLPYEAVCAAASPDNAILAFAQSTYDAASSLAGWDREALEEKKPALHSRGGRS